MMLIRSARVENNTAGRAGCQFQSPFTNAIYYCSVEHGAIVLRDWGQVERGREGGVTLIPSGGVSACFASPGQVCVTVSGFDAGQSNSGMDTYILSLVE